MSGPVLLLDIGNTRAKWRIVGTDSTDEFVGQGAFATALLDAGTVPDDFLHSMKAAGVRRAWVASVASARATETIDSLPLRVEWFRSSAAACGVVNGYDAPTQLGVDRWAALIAAARLGAGQAVLVVMAGTALTVDAITADGVFHGGMIAPGLSTMRASLNANTARLPQVTSHVDGGVGGDALARDTTSAIGRGVCDAALGVIDAGLRRLTALAGGTPRIVISGGDATAVAEALRFVRPSAQTPILRDNLVLDGLAIVARELTLGPSA